MKTCLHRGECKDCKIDYEPISPSHPRNNLSCNKYYELNLQTCEVIEKPMPESKSLDKLTEKL